MSSAEREPPSDDPPGSEANRDRASTEAGDAGAGETAARERTQGTTASPGSEEAEDLPSTVTLLLRQWSRGEAAALGEVMPLVVAELQQIARAFLARESAGHTLQPTALVNELFLRLVNQRQVRWENRAQFYAFSATLMRRILVDHAREKRALKRGGGATLVPLDEARPGYEPRSIDLLALDDALARLETVDQRLSQVVELRFFAGLTLEEIRDLREVSMATVSRDWATARAWLYRELSGGRDRA